jgi:3'(2'), 5'-bisphosphate nucleotidase
VVEGLAAAFPGDLILSEESGLRGPADAAHLWIIDPLDGTEAFVDPRTRGYAVQIARARRDGDRFVLELGVVYEPHAHTLFAATIDGPVTREIDGVVVPLPVRPPAPLPPRIVTSTRISKPLRDRFLARGYADGGELRSVGIKVAHLLEGHADLYLATHGLAAWDLAAPQVLLEAAGGRVTDLDGQPPRYDVARLLGTAPPTSADVTARGDTKPRGPQGLVFTLGLDHADALAALRRTH